MSYKRGDYKVGDYVVCLEGGITTSHFKGNIHKIKQLLNNGDDWFDSYYNNESGIYCKHCRLATPEEIEAYNQGIRNIKDIKNIKDNINIGDEIEFIGNEDLRIPLNFITDPEIPRDKIIHGDTYFKENKGIVKDIYKDFYLISFIDKYDKEVRLGFKKESFKVINSINKQTKIEENEYKESKNTGTIIKTKRITPIIRQGSGITGNRVSGKKCRTATASRYISHKEVIGI